jgi:hypothetical protein
MINKISKFLLILLAIGVIGLFIKGHIERNDLEKNGKITVGSYISHRGYPKTESNYFAFYVNGKRCERDAGRVPNGFKYNRGKFYLIHYSEKYSAFEVLFDKEVTDTLKILEAGFTKEDIELALRTQKKNRDFIR